MDMRTQNWLFGLKTKLKGSKNVPLVDKEYSAI